MNSRRGGGRVLAVCASCGRVQDNMRVDPVEIELGGRFYAGCRYCGHPTGRYR